MICKFPRAPEFQCCCCMSPCQSWGVWFISSIRGHDLKTALTLKFWGKGAQDVYRGLNNSCTYGSSPETTLADRRHLMLPTLDFDSHFILGHDPIKVQRSMIYFYRSLQGHGEILKHVLAIDPSFLTSNPWSLVMASLDLQPRERHLQALKTRRQWTWDHQISAKIKGGREDLRRVKRCGDYQWLLKPGPRQVIL